METENNFDCINFCNFFFKKVTKIKKTIQNSKEKL